MIIYFSDSKNCCMKSNTEKNMEDNLYELSRRLQKANQHKENNKKYSLLRTDEERVKFTMKLIHEYNLPPVVTCEEKSVIQSRKFRDEGNKLFTTLSATGKTYLNESVEKYAKSIAFAPSGSRELSLAFASRSAALFKAGLFDDCLLDIDRALSFDYPDELKAKLFARRARCLIVLEGASDKKVKKALEDAQKWLEKMNLENTGRSTVEKILNDPMKMASTNKKFEKWDEEKFCPKITGEMNSEIMGASSAIELKYSEKMGKHVVASREIQAGEILAVQTGYSFVLTSDKMYTNCSHCLKQTWSSIPCNYCVHVIYCNEECRDAAWKEHHDIECQVIGPLVGVEMSYLSLLSMRMIITAWKAAGSFEKIRKIVEDADAAENPRTDGFTGGKLDDKKYASVYTLARNTEKRSIPDLFGRSYNTVYIVYMLATRSNFFGEKLEGNLISLGKNKWVTFIGGLIMRHLQIIPSNAHSVTEILTQDPDERAAAIMPFYSLINHSCDPSVTRVSFGKNMVIYAISGIKKGEQIFDNYGMHYALDIKSIRQQKLLKQFHFECECEACVKNWPLYKFIPSWQHQTLSDDDRKALENAVLKFPEYCELVMHGNNMENTVRVLEDLSDMINFFMQRIHPPCRDVNEMVETLKRIYGLLGNRCQSLD